MEIVSAEIVATETHVEIEQKPFTVYRIAVAAEHGSAWVVAKRFGDFAGLRAALQAVDRRGNSVVTKQKFPPKHIYGSLQEEVVANRRETLQRWLTVAMEQYRRAVPLISFLEDDGSDNSTQDLLAAKSFLRGTALRLERPLTAWGNRTSREKSCFLVSADTSQVLSLLTLSSPPLAQPCPVAIAHRSNSKHLKSFLLEIDHPFLVPTLEVEYMSQISKLLLFRPLFKLGSLRDLLYKVKNPVQRCSSKYVVGRGVGLNERMVALYARHVLEGMHYLAKLKVSCEFVRCGNVLLREKEWCCLTDYENSILGLPPPRLPRAVLNGRMVRDKPGRQHYADVLAFGLLLYELSSGHTMDDQAPSFIMPACPMEVQRLLDRIFNSCNDNGNGGDCEPPTVEALLADSFFNGVELPPRLEEQREPPREKTKKQSKRLKKSLLPAPSDLKEKRSAAALGDRGPPAQDISEPEPEPVPAPPSPPNQDDYRPLPAPTAADGTEAEND